MRNLIIVILTCAVALIYSCTYSESGIYYVDPIPGDPPIISAVTNLDTIIDPIVVDSLEVVYEVEIENGEFYQVEAYVLDSRVYFSDTTNGSFWINNSVVEEPGVDTLRIFFLHSTNSNSLADVIGLEYSSIQLDYAILFEKGGKQ